ncbi:MAG: methionine--tRNA ligase subunit beta [Candidatus Paceibacterota bacterium]|nr:methionine--tRNA ligase subunit beta [Candidatus Paceibacterota bacterium]
MEQINIEDFSKIEIKIGKIVEAEKIEQSNKLLKLKVDFGNDDIRQVLSGIAKYYGVEDILNKKFAFVTNLEPRKMLEYESQAMILASHDEATNTVSILIPDKDVEAGSKVN